MNTSGEDSEPEGLPIEHGGGRGDGANGSLGMAVTSAAGAAAAAAAREVKKRRRDKGR